jgi:hypothetical protein
MKKWDVVWLNELVYTPRESGVHLEDDGDVIITWGGYDYTIPCELLETPERVLGWIVHLGEKEGWEGMTPWRLGRFVEKVAQHRGWDIWREPTGIPGTGGETPETPETERQP